jgi:SlyX protein
VIPRLRMRLLPPLNERVKRLEEKVAYLERHVTEQDKAMLGFSDDLARLRQELRQLREQATGGARDQGETGDQSRDERPPHY